MRLLLSAVKIQNVSKAVKEKIVCMFFIHLFICHWFLVFFVKESAERALGTPGWAEVAQRSGITVWKMYFPKDEYGHQYPCVKARGVIIGSAEEVMGMIVDSARVLEYNRCDVGQRRYPTVAACFVLTITFLEFCSYKGRNARTPK